ncbi:MAG: nitroreductase family protein [Planctomycetota bacterium]
MTDPNRLAPTQTPVLEAVRQRWSPRAYDPEARIPADQLRTMFEAAAWASSSFNEQPWRFVLATPDTPEQFQAILQTMAEANQAWAQHASLLIATAGKTDFSKNGKPNRCWQHDVGQAMAHLSLQAAALGWQVHQMAGVDLEALRAAVAIPEGYEPFTVSAIGRVGDAGALPEAWMRDAESAPRVRKPLDEVVFDTWGEPAEALA